VQITIDLRAVLALQVFRRTPLLKIELGRCIEFQEQLRSRQQARTETFENIFRCNFIGAKQITPKFLENTFFVRGTARRPPRLTSAMPR
jgi:hypothetical protein